MFNKSTWNFVILKIFSMKYIRQEKIVKSRRHFCTKKLSNQGAEEARKIRQIKASFSARKFRQINLRSVINIGFLKECSGRRLEPKYFYYPDLIVVISFEMVGYRSKFGHRQWIREGCLLMLMNQTLIQALDCQINHVGARHCRKPLGRH